MKHFLSMTVGLGLAPTYLTGNSNVFQASQIFASKVGACSSRAPIRCSSLWTALGLTRKD